MTQHSAAEMNQRLLPTVDCRLHTAVRSRQSAVGSHKPWRYFSSMKGRVYGNRTGV
jgi:hypothetical protein